MPQLNGAFYFVKLLLPDKAPGKNTESIVWCATQKKRKLFVYEKEAQKKTQTKCS